MTEEKKLTEEEQKAKEYVDFYYFWLFHYCGRNYKLELQKKLPPLAQVAQENFYEVNEQRREIAQTIYWGHPLSSMYPQFLYDNDFTDVDDLFDGDCISGEYPCSFLQSLYEGKPIHKHVERNEEYGLEILGTSGAHISTEGKLRGSIIARIDLRAPDSVLLYELSKLRNAKFAAFPEYLDAPSLFGLRGDYTHESRIIRQTTNASFAAKDDAARAIGLWLWDCIDLHGIVGSVADALRLVDGDPVSGMSYSEHEEGEALRCVHLNSAVKNNGYTITDYEIPSREIFVKLGYASSEPSVFRRLYRNTKRCIENCEVLSLAD